MITVILKQIRRPAVAISLVLLMVVAVGSAATLAVMSGGTNVRDDGVLRAAIVDQLSLYTPNPEFIEGTTGLLEQAGYEVDYFEGHDVTVDLYRNLPTQRYDIVIVRGHSGISRKVDRETGQVSEAEYVSLSTGELYYNYLHEEDQSRGLLGWSVVQENEPPVFGFGYEFVQRAMRGNFGGAVIIMMGCDGLRTRDTAQAFLDRGASAFVSWSQPVSSYQTDRATRLLVEKIMLGEYQLEEAVAATAGEVGADPWYGGELRILQ